MKSEKLYDAITEIREDLIERAQEQDLRQLKSPKKKWRWLAACAVLVVILTGNLVVRTEACPKIPDLEPVEENPQTPPSAAHDWKAAPTAYRIFEAQYPQMAPYPEQRKGGESFSEAYDAWRKDLDAQRQPSGYADGLQPFFASSIQQFLLDADEENRVYSPLNVFMALGMLAEVTDGACRAQILDLVGCQDISELRTQASRVWNGAYRKDGAVSSVLASSLWLSQDISFRKPTMEALAENYYASSYRGNMGEPAFQKALQDWLYTQTGGLLKEFPDVFSKDTALALATTVYFQSKWENPFDEQATHPEIFHSVNGDMQVDFMHGTNVGTYYWADQFGAVTQKLESGGEMWFLLPDEGVSVDKILTHPQLMDLILHSDKWENQKDLIIHESVPKFDVSSQMELRPGLQALGITDVFDARVSDFSPLSEDAPGLYLSETPHHTRVAIDEEGITAAAYTVMSVEKSARPPAEEMDFTLNRPFVFVITSPDHLPLFAGVVQQPK